MKSALSIYHALPYPAQVVVASAKGLSLRWWRRGARFDSKVDSALARERWDPEAWREWSTQRLQRLLASAASEVPYYRALWGTRGAAPAELTEWPMLRKETLRNAPERFVSEAARKRRLLTLHTSGTTGTPLRVTRDREAATEWYALCEARIQRWGNCTPTERWAVLGGQLVTATSRNRPPFWVWNAAMRQLYMSSYHLSAANIRAYLNAMDRYRISCIEGYASSLYELAIGILGSSLSRPGIRLIVSYAEPLHDHQRLAIESAFGCPVRNTYGMTETVAGASECERGSLHLWPDAGVFEVLRDDEDVPAAPGEYGRVVCTGLVNDAMPLIRYEIGDRAALASPEEWCPCGRTLPILAGIEGRSDDVIVTAEGRRIGRLDPVFKADVPIVEAQIIQEAVDSYRIRIVPAPGYEPGHDRVLAGRLRERVGEARITVESVAAIPRTASGKFRAVVSFVGGRREPLPQVEPR